MMKALLLTIMLLTSVAFAKDLGTIGHTYRIAEPDLMSDIEKRAASVDWKSVISKAKKDTKEKVGIVKSVLPRAEANKTYYLDMTYVLDHDINTYNSKGDVTGVLYPKGFIYNVLDYIQVQETYVFLNGNRSAEVDWFKRTYSGIPLVYPIISEGNTLKVAEKLGRPVYALRDNMKKLFRLEATVSVVYPERRRMRVDEVVVQDEKDNHARNSHNSGRK